MPFQSEAQRRYMHANHPEIAKRFEAETPKGKKLPEHKGRAKLEKKVGKGLKKAFPK